MLRGVAPSVKHARLSCLDAHHYRVTHVQNKRHLEYRARLRGFLRERSARFLCNSC